MSFDKCLEMFLAQQTKEALELAAASDLLHIEPVGPAPSQHFIAVFRCIGLVHERGAIGEADRFIVGYYFPRDYLRRADARATVSILAPTSVFHPNCAAPACCLGRVPPGTTLAELLYATHAVLTYNRFTPREDDALNPAACAWARNNMDRFPVDRRPLKWHAASPPADGGSP